MNRHILLIVILLSFVTPGFSHYHWIEPADFNASKEGPLDFYICSGHQFPKRELLLRKDLVFSVRVLKGDEVIPVDISEDDISWKGRVELKVTDHVILEFKLKKRTGKAPFYYGRSILKLPASSGGKETLMTGEGLEIVPEITPGTKAILFRVFLDGKPVRSNLVLVREGKKPVYLNPGKDDTLMAEVKSPGRYMATTHFGGFGASLTFFISD